MYQYGTDVVLQTVWEGFSDDLPKDPNAGKSGGGAQGGGTSGAGGNNGGKAAVAPVRVEAKVKAPETWRGDTLQDSLRRAAFSNVP